MKYVAEFTLIYVVEADSEEQATDLAMQIEFRGPPGPIHAVTTGVEQQLWLQGKVEVDKRSGQLTALYKDTEER